MAYREAVGQEDHPSEALEAFRVAAFLAFRQEVALEDAEAWEADP